MWWPLLLLGLACGVLLVDACSFKFATEQLSTTVIYGQGERFAMRARRADLLMKPELRTVEFEAFLKAEREDGLKYIGIEHDRELIVEAGKRPAIQGIELKPGLPHDMGDMIVLMVPSLSAERSPAKRHDGVVAPPKRRPLKLQNKQASKPGTMMLLVYEPLKARALSRRANIQILVVLLTTFVVLTMGWKLGQVWRKQAHLQALYQQRKRLAELGQMSAVLAHELRNPLTSLKGHSQLLYETLEARGDGLAPKVDRIIFESTRLERLVNSLLEFVRTGELDLSTVDVADSIRELVTHASPSGEVSLHISSELEGERWRIDMVRLGVALSNILTNAMQHSTHTHVGVACEGDDVIVQIEDDGDGIPPEHITDIFEPFVTFKANGVGLGLAIARDVIVRHGGHIHAQNKDAAAGGGARFTIRMPRAPQADRG